MLENLKKLLEGASEEELQEIIDFTEASVDQCEGFTLRCILEFQDCINEQLEKISRPEDTVYILTRKNSRDEDSEEGTLSELIADNKGWLESYLPSKQKHRVYKIVELLNLSYEGTYWSDTEYSFDVA